MVHTAGAPMFWNRSILETIQFNIIINDLEMDCALFKFADRVKLKVQLLVSTKQSAG